MTRGVSAFIPVLLCVLLVSAGPADAAPRAGGCAGADKTISSLRTGEIRAAILCVINENRGAKKVKRNAKLQKAAQRHTRVMERHNLLCHQCPGEPTLIERVKRTGYSSTLQVGEVIIKTITGTSPRNIVKAWMASPPHAKEIRRRIYKHAGVGVVVKNGFVWATTVFGRP